MPAETERRQNIADVRLTVDGKDFTDKAAPRLISLRLCEKRGGDADQLDLELDDSDGALALPRKGAIIALEIGWRQGDDVTVGLVDKGKYRVDEVCHGGPPDTVTVRARSADLDSGYRVRKERSWKNTTLGRVLKDIAAGNGLTALVDADLAAISVKLLTQHEKSDMALVRELGRKYDAVATVKDRKLLFAPIGKGKTASGKDIPPMAIARGDGDRHDFRAVDRDQYDGVEARWHDQDGAKRETERVAVTDSRGQKTKRLRRVYSSKADARAAAKAEAGRIQRGSHELDLSLALGRPDAYPERRMTVSGFKKDIDALTWLIAEVTHDLDGRGGFRTSLKLETAV